MLGFLRAVVEVQPAVDDLDVIERKTGCRAVGSGGRAGEFVDEILKVVLSIIIANQADIGL